MTEDITKSIIMDLDCLDQSHESLLQDIRLEGLIKPSSPLINHRSLKVLYQSDQEEITDLDKLVSSGSNEEEGGIQEEDVSQSRNRSLPPRRKKSNSTTDKKDPSLEQDHPSDTDLAFDKFISEGTVGNDEDQTVREILEMTNDLNNSLMDNSDILSGLGHSTTSFCSAEIEHHTNSSQVHQKFPYMAKNLFLRIHQNFNNLRSQNESKNHGHHPRMESAISTSNNNQTNGYIFCQNCTKKPNFCCSVCRKTHYCSPECQRYDWSHHSKICVKNGSGT